METKTQIVLLGRRKRLELSRKRDAVELLAFSVIWIPTVLFVAEVGWYGFQDFSVALATLNRLSALLATSLLLVHLALIARIPWIESIIGLDKLTLAHKRLGKPILYLLIFHALTSTLSFASVDSKPIMDAFLYLTMNYWSLALAALSLGLFVVVVVTSIRIVRKKIKYESWYLVHLLSYIAVFASIPHQYELGTDFLVQPLMQTYFTLLYIFVGLNLVWFRVLQPVVMSLGSDLRVVNVKPEANRTTSISIGGKSISRFGAEAGQFFLLRVLTRRQWWRPHPFSVSSDPGREVRFTVGNRGDDTALLQEIKIGTRVILEGPFGVFSESKRSRQHVTLMAAGIGVAPIRALAESLASEPGDITVIYRVNDDSDAALLSELERICSERQHTLKLVKGPRAKSGSFLPERSENDPPLADELRLLELAPEIKSSDVYICGPAAWSKSVKASLRRLGIERSHIHIEEFAW